MAELEIRLFGEFQIIIHGESPIVLSPPRMQSLLAYLLLNADTPQTRQHLAFLFWPESNEHQSRTNLRNLIYQIRHAYPRLDTFLKITPQTMCWRSDADYQLDVDRFRASCRIVGKATASVETVRAALEQAVECYRNDLLPGLYDEWIVNERELLRLQFHQSLERLVILLESHRQYPAAIIRTHQLLAADPLREETCRTLIRLYALNGERGKAIRAYQEFASHLKRELDLPPTRATREGYQRIVDAVDSIAASEHLEQTPLPSISLIGRHDERKEMQSVWQQVVQGKTGVVIVVGEPGIGKTTLAEDLCSWVAHQGFPTVWAQCHMAEGRPAYAPVVEWLHATTFQRGLSTLEDVWLKELSRLVPEIRTRHPSLEPPTILVGDRQRRQLFDALGQAVLAISQPLLLVIDDLHYCDTSTLEWLHYLLRSQSVSKTLVVGTMCPYYVSDESLITRWRLDLAKRNQLTEIELGRFDITHTVEVMQAMLRRPVNNNEVLHYFTESEGHPLYLTESLHTNGFVPLPDATSLTENGSDLASMVGESPELPPKIRAMFEIQLQELSPAVRQIVALGAVIGTDFGISTLLAACDGHEADVVQALDEACRCGILQETDHNRYAFTHHKLRQLIVSGLSMGHYRLLRHRFAATQAEDPR